MNRPENPYPMVLDHAISEYDVHFGMVPIEHHTTVHGIDWP